MDIMQIEIMPDGEIKVKTTDVSKVNHMSADQLLDEIESLAGGQRRTEENKEAAKRKVHHHKHHHVKAGHSH
jgi:DNA repair ATPase RecN